MGKGNPSVLRLRGRCLIFIIFGGVIYVLADNSITMRGFTSCMISILTMIFSINDFRKPLLNHVGSQKFTTHAIEMTGFTLHQCTPIMCTLQFFYVEINLPGSLFVMAVLGCRSLVLDK